MESWQELTNQEEYEAWNLFDNTIRLSRWNAMKDPRGSQTDYPSTTYNIEAGYGDEDLENDLQQKSLKAFRRLVTGDDFLFALDWQHQCYRFWPQHQDVVPDAATWKVPILPDGDNYFFLASDLRFGMFGYCMNYTICVYGEELLQALDQDKPKLFAVEIPTL